jgi:pimeloyl-ACP methyl ester carboxylesterase
MSRRSTALAAAGGALTGLALGAAGVIVLTGRTRPAVPGLESPDPPEGLPPGRVVAVPGHGELFVREQPGPSPSAPTVVLLHGWVASADLNWWTSWGALADVARVIALDHRGHGRGSRPSTPFRLADAADDAAALLDLLGTGPCVVVGYSMGGPIAQLLWQRRPDLVAGLVLCATAAQFRFGPLQGAHWRLMAVYQVVLRLLPRTWLEKVLLAQMTGRAPRALIRTVGTEMADAVPLLPWMVGEVERGDVEDVAEAGRELGRFDSRGWMRGCDVPGALIVTTRDRLVPPNAQLELAAMLPHALVVEVEGDHDTPAAHRRVFAAALRQAVEHVLAEGAAAAGA